MSRGGLLFTVALFLVAMNVSTGSMNTIAFLLAPLAVCANVLATSLAWRRQRPSRLSIASQPDPQLLLGARKRGDIVIGCAAAVSLSTLVAAISGHLPFLTVFETGGRSAELGVALPFSAMTFCLTWLTSRRGRSLANEQMTAMPDRASDDSVPGGGR